MHQVIGATAAADYGRIGVRLAFRAGASWSSIDAGDGLRLGLHPPGRAHQRRAA